jgi:hypothetical protein
MWLDGYAVCLFEDLLRSSTDQMAVALPPILSYPHLDPLEDDAACFSKSMFHRGRSPAKILEANAISECEDECRRCAVVGGTIRSCALPNNVGIVIVKMNCCGCISLVNRKGRRTMRNGSGSLDNNYSFLLPPPSHIRKLQKLPSFRT